MKSREWPFGRLFPLLAMFILIVCEFAGVCVRSPTPQFDSTSMLNITASKGDNVEFRCKVGDLGDSMVAFLKAEDPPRLLSYDEMVFRQSEKFQMRRKPNEDEWILTVRNVGESDAGGYTCQLNTNPVLTKTAFLRLQIPPMVSRSSTPSAVEVREGQNVSLSCEASGDPKPRVIWRRQDRQIIRFNGATGYGSSVYNGSELFLTRVSRKHMSEYVCVASNGIPPDESWTVKLHVTFEPVVVAQSTVVESRQGSLVRLVCNVESWPRALVSWFFNDVELYDSTRYTTEQSVSERYKSVHVLEIRYLEQSQFGIYKCLAVNDHGKHFAEIRLIESGEPNTEAVIRNEGSGAENPDTETEPTADSADDEDLTNNRRPRFEDDVQTNSQTSDSLTKEVSALEEVTSKSWRRIPRHLSAIITGFFVLISQLRILSL